ncbi:MAG: hypothetical protein AAGA78_05730 [Pseudomonadota bacterium]
MRPVILATSLCLTLLACGGSSGSGSGSGSLGSGWFSGGDRAAEPTPEPIIVDESVPVTAIRSAVLEPALRGSILRVSAVAGRLGFHSARLKLLGPDENGRVLVEFRAIAPRTPIEGRSQGQVLSAASFISKDTLSQISELQLNGQNGVITLRP